MKIPEEKELENGCLQKGDLLELGTQPIDAKMAEAGLSNHDLVAASSEQITHKMVAKARKGRRLSPNVKNKILRAFNAATKQECPLHDLFNY